LLPDPNPGLGSSQAGETSLRDRIRSVVVAAIALAVTWSALALAPVGAAGPKVVIIVGPTGSQTSSYRSTGDSIAATAQSAGATVVKVYSPNATWANVRAAVNGANIIVYLGHGNGYPNPYNSVESTDRVNGWGLNRTTSNGDSDNWSTTMVYCGEKALLGTLTSSDGAAQRTYCTGGISPAPGFVMIYNKACYTPGAGEGFDVKATESVAFQRVRNYSYPVLKKGASAYFATDLHNGAQYLVDTILRHPEMTYGDVTRNAPGYDAVAQRHFGHPDLTGKQVWIQRTGSDPDYWFGYAGNPAASYANPNAPPTVSSLKVVRYAGANRYATAAAVSAASFAPGVPVAYVATGANFPDALAGGAAAAVKGGPVLLVTADEIPSETAAELERLQPSEIIVLGGTGAVRESTLKALAVYSTGNVTRRIAGSTRYETAAAISADGFAPGVPVAYVATGANFPDALAGTPVAGSQGGPVLLTDRDELPAAVAAELDRLNPGRIVILGATGAVSSAVASELASYTTGSVTRLSGADRYATAVAVSKANFTSAETVFVATGVNFPDALAGAPVAGMQDSPLLLVTGTSLPDVVRAELLRLSPSKVVVLGSTGVVSNTVVSQMQALFS
jgi:putative cell wall-binding protein